MEISEFINMLLLVLLIFHAYGIFLAKTSKLHINAKLLHGCFISELFALFCVAVISNCVFFVWPEFAFFCLAVILMCANYHLLIRNTVQRDKIYQMRVTHVSKEEHIVFGEIRERFSFSSSPALSHIIPCALFGYETFDEAIEGKELPVKFSDFNTSALDKRYDVEVEISDQDSV